MSVDKRTARALIVNTYEAEVSVHKYGDVDDLCPGTCPPGFLVLLDAEMEFVAYVPREKADALAAILTWAEVAATAGSDE